MRLRIDTFINRISTTRLEYDSHFTFSLPGGDYNDPCYTYAGRPWEDYSDTEKVLATEVTCHGCQQPIAQARLRERIQKPVESEGYTKDSPDRFVFVFYQDWCLPNGSRQLNVRPQYLESFHAYPVVGEPADFNKADQLDFKLVGYGLGTKDLKHIVYRLHWRADDNRIEPDENHDLFYHLDAKSKSFIIPQRTYEREGQQVFYSLYRYVRATDVNANRHQPFNKGDFRTLRQVQ